jgi:hypothetical protein
MSFVPFIMSLNRSFKGALQLYRVSPYFPPPLIGSPEDIISTNPSSLKNKLYEVIME